MQMMTVERHQIINSIQMPLQGLLGINPEYLATRPALGLINFDGAQPLFQELAVHVKQFSSLEWQSLPTETLRGLVSPFEVMGRAMLEIQQFEWAHKQYPEKLRDDLKVRFEKAYYELFSATASIMAYLKLRALDIDAAKQRLTEVEQAFQELMTQSKNLSQELRQELDKTKAEANSIVSAMRDAAAETAVGKFTSVFKDLATDYGRRSRNWFIGTVALIVVTIALGLFMVLSGKPDLGAISEGNTIQWLITKLVILSILYFAILASARLYRINRHLVVVNEHRQTALSTFEAFIKSSNDPQAKAAVLLETTRCIFSSSATGYLEGADDNPNSRIIEILKTVSPGGQKA